MTDFIPVLVVATLLLAGLLIGFGGYIVPVDDTDATGVQSTSYYVDKISLGTDFIVSDYQQSHKFLDIEGNISSGLTSSIDKTVSFSASKLNEIDQGRIVLDIEDTNLYGMLMIYVNNNLVYRDATAIGTHEIRFNKNYMNKTDNTLTIRAEGSGWRIWAPTVYTYDLELYGETDDVSEQITEFELDFIPTDARVFVYVADSQGTGQYKVVANGYKIFGGRSNGFKDFDPCVFKKANNVVAISCDAGSKF